MAAKKEASALRGAKLIKKAIEVAKTAGTIAAPEPIPTAKKLKLPNGESISPGMKELLAFDGSWLAIEWDEDENEIEGMSLDEVIEEHFGEEAVAAFGEATELLSEDCVFFGGELSTPACLYCGTADDAGEYPVLVFSWTDGAARVGGFVPFDVWAAQELGALERGADLGGVPEAYAALPKALADSNGDGRVLFSPVAGEGRGSDDDDEGDEDEEGDGDGEGSQGAT